MMLQQIKERVPLKAGLLWGCFGILVAFALDHYVINVKVHVNPEPPVTVHNVGIRVDGRTLLMRIDRTKHRHCPSVWVVQAQNNSSKRFHQLSREPGTVTQVLRREILVFPYQLPFALADGTYTLFSEGIYECDDGGQHTVTQPALEFTIGSD